MVPTEDTEERKHDPEPRVWEPAAGRWSVTDRISYCAYGMNLAEITAPCPFITKWGTDIPILLAHNIVYWSPETMGGWESMMPG